ncbi:DedA family protein [Hydrogenimonas thermophila]|uniref:Membrane protein DedA, SNARE-associated domain n=1 Tax=Hydrogenimonas thermophila TaxID=223786 RepID=A0A1I5LW76_9BACT|nr:DedA family protein [Hydrogenimonas thermophila]WOE70465.1 DedA family protein [Hydrogenimonas thermophila]WOE72982.1 DedA family protein [Hydrogenimonas thermophila]SFP01433.1 membrane protein DedA, SNARE-associated domain [Hydrogenimonas thermophila]
MAEIVNWIVETVGTLGYLGIFIMMFLESSFFPFPSEVAMIPAGYLASKGEMNLITAFVAGAGGSLAGAIFNYILGHKLGRPFLIKYGKYFFIKEETIKKTELFFQKYGSASTLFGRLIPGIRQYISLPAGIAKMPLLSFSIYTFIGAGIWCIVLLSLGYIFGEHEDKIQEAMHYILLGISILIIVVFYYFRKKSRVNK